MNNYILLTNPQVKKIFLAAFNEGQIRKKTYSEIFSNEWEIFIEKQFQFGTKSQIKEIKTYENGVTSIYTRGENIKFEEIVYDENFDWNLVYTVVYDGKEYSIGDKIVRKGDKTGYTIERFGLSTLTTSFKVFRNIIEVYVSEIMSGYFAELCEIDEFKEPISFTYDGKPAYENDIVFVYNKVSKQKYPVSAQKMKTKSASGVVTKTHNLKEEPEWLIFSSMDAIKEYEKIHDKKHSLMDFKNFLAYIAEKHDGIALDSLFDEITPYFNKR